MSVLVSDRTESKFEAITYSIELHDMLIDFMQHGFGVKSVDDYVRLRYAYGKDDRENFSKYRFMMQNFKNRVDQLAALITNNVRAANTIYPTNLHECEMRRDYQNTANQLKGEVYLSRESDLKYIYTSITSYMKMTDGFYLETSQNFMTI